MTISENLKLAVEKAIKAGVSRYEIAKQAGIDYAGLSRWLDDGTDIRASTIDKLASYFGLELSPAKPSKPAKTSTKRKT